MARDFASISPPRINGPHSLKFGCVAYYPSLSPHHYQIVCIWHCNSVVLLGWDLLAHDLPLEAHRWSIHHRHYSDFGYCPFFHGFVFWNSSVHWISTWRTSKYFSLAEECTRRMPMPCILNAWNDVRSYRYFGESRAYLHNVDNRYNLLADYLFQCVWMGMD